jgi:ribonuclease P protein component
VTDAGGDRRFPRDVRLRRPLDFKAVYAGRLSVAAGPLVLYGLRQPEATTATRLGLSVSRRVGKAVVRNRWKRRLRDVFRRLRARLPAGFDLVVVVRAVGPPRAGAAGVAAIERLLLDLVGRLVRKIGRRAGAAGPSDQGSSPDPAKSSPPGQGS